MMERVGASVSFLMDSSSQINTSQHTAGLKLSSSDELLLFLHLRDVVNDADTYVKTDPHMAQALMNPLEGVRIMPVYVLFFT